MLMSANEKVYNFDKLSTLNKILNYLNNSHPTWLSEGPVLKFSLAGFAKYITQFSLNGLSQ
jgi:hypothetical protein